jgi:DNA-binding beta-propeller fold protein YncE
MCKRVLPLLALLVLSLGSPDGLAEEFEMIELPSIYKAYGSALTPDSSYLFVIATTGVVLVYDVDQDLYIESIDLRDHVVRPSNGAIVRGKLYIQSFRHIAVVDVATRELVRVIDQAPHIGSSYGAVVPSHSRDRIYTVGGSTTDLTVLDPETDEVVGRVAVGGDYTGMDLSLDGSKLYLSNCEENKLAIVDTASLAVTQVVPFYSGGGMLSYGTEVQVGPCDGCVFVSYVDGSSRGRVSVLSPDGERIGNYVVNKFSTGIDITADGRYLVLGCGKVLQPSTGAVIGEIGMPVTGLSHVTLSPDGMRAYVANINDPYVKAIEGFVAPLQVEFPAGDSRRVTLRLNLPGEAGRLFQIGASLDTDPGIHLTDGRVVPLHIDALLRQSIKDDSPAFVDFSGSLDASGKAEAAIDFDREFPGNTVGRKIYLLFVTLEEKMSRSDVRVISNLVDVTVMD